jgi:hypothetical protein
MRVFLWLGILLAILGLVFLLAGIAANAVLYLAFGAILALGVSAATGM